MNFHFSATTCMFYKSIRSVSSNFDDLVSLVNSSKNKLDILLLTESWVNEHTFDLLNLPGYNSFHIYIEILRKGAVLLFF